RLHQGTNVIAVVQAEVEIKGQLAMKIWISLTRLALLFLMFGLSSEKAFGEAFFINTFFSQVPSTTGLTSPNGVAIDGQGNVYVSDRANNIVLRRTPTGTLTVVAGTGVGGYSGDNGPATSAKLNYPTGLALDASGNLFIADSQNFRIRRVTSAGIITTV